MKHKYLILLLLSLIIISYRFSLVETNLEFLTAWAKVKKIRVDELEARIDKLEQK